MATAHKLLVKHPHHKCTARKPDCKLCIQIEPNMSGWCIHPVSSTCSIHLPGCMSSWLRFAICIVSVFYYVLYPIVCKFRNLAHLHVDSCNARSGQYSGAKCKEGNDHVTHDDRIVVFGAWSQVWMVMSIEYSCPFIPSLYIHFVSYNIFSRWSLQMLAVFGSSRFYLAAMQYKWNHLSFFWFDAPPTSSGEAYDIPCLLADTM